MRVLFEGAALGVALLASGISQAQGSRWGVRIFLSESQPIFSSEDLRKGGGFGVNYTVPFPRLRFRSHRAELIWEGHYDITASPGASGKPPNTIAGYGLMASARYRGHSRAGTAGYAEFGWGLYITEHLSVDLDNRLNSTPTIGVGIVSRSGWGNEVFLGLRLMHISNGGLAKGNQGQNRLQLTLGAKL